MFRSTPTPTSNWNPKKLFPLLGVFLLGCSNQVPNRGKIVYNSSCTVCHNPNPKLVGSVGPDVFGSSEELLFKKIREGKYPSGYTPKRATNMMPKMNWIPDSDIRELRKFLNEGN